MPRSVTEHPVPYEPGQGYVDLPTFDPPLADATRYPEPGLRVAPRRPVAAVQSAKTNVALAVADLRVDRARTGLYLIARLLGPRRVWTPDYHCPAMVEPVIAAGCEVAFYPVTATLEPDLPFLAGRVVARDAVIGVRFFGFDSGIRDLSAFCSARNAVLIEDLAHAACFDRLHGDFGVTSLRKFFPVAAGADVLAPADSQYSAALRESCRALPAEAGRWRAALQRVMRRVRPQASGPVAWRYFRESDMRRGVVAGDAATLSAVDRDVIGRQRRENYRYLAAALHGCPAGEVLFPGLPAHVVPYVLPFVLRDAGDFDRIRGAAIQALRWEEMVPTGSSLVDRYRHRLVQLPVHQDLERPELERIAAAVTGAV